MNNVALKPITRALINRSFQEISDFFGFDIKEYVEEIAALLHQWEDQGFVEIYQTNEDKAFGMLKSSDLNNCGQIVPYYIGLYHARLVNGDNDPLVVVKFREDEPEFHTENATHAVDMRFMVSHDDIFGTKKQKRDPSVLRGIWREIDAKIKAGD